MAVIHSILCLQEKKTCQCENKTKQKHHSFVEYNNQVKFLLLIYHNWQHTERGGTNYILGYWISCTLYVLSLIFSCIKIIHYKIALQLFLLLACNKLFLWMLRKIVGFFFSFFVFGADNVRAFQQTAKRTSVFSQNWYTWALLISFEI